MSQRSLNKTVARLFTTRNIILLWTIAVVTVVTGSLLSANSLSRLHYNTLSANDKAVHFLGYAVLSILPVAFLELLNLGIALAASMIPMGVGLEFAQRFSPGRSFEIGDMIADSMGVLVGTLLALALRSAWKRSAFHPASGNGTSITS